MSDGVENGAEICILKEVLQQKDQRIHTLEADLLTLKEQLSWLQKQVFGVKSERLIDLHDQPLLPGFDQKAQDAEPEQEEVHFKRRKNKKNRLVSRICGDTQVPVTCQVRDIRRFVSI